MAAVMVLMPVVVKFIMEGLIPISKGAKVIMDKHFKGGNFTIGMDPALLLGNSDVIAAGLLFVPITLLIAILVPGNKVLPLAIWQQLASLLRLQPAFIKAIFLEL